MEYKPKCNFTCDTHKDRKYLKWTCGEIYNSNERRDRFLRDKVPCPICNRLKTSISETCNRCIYVNKPHHLKGKKLPKWWCERISKGQINRKKNRTTSINKLIRGNKKFTEWRIGIFERDNYTCVDCYIRGGDLHPHHIKELSEIIKTNNIKTVREAVDCLELWSINNGITLCINCHKKRHHPNIKWGTRRSRYFICKMCRLKSKAKRANLRKFCSKDCYHRYSSINGNSGQFIKKI